MDNNTTQILLAIISLIGTVFAGYFAFRAQQLGAKTHTQGVDTGKKVELLEHHMNDMKDQLVLSTHAEGVAAGTAAGIEIERRRAERLPPKE